MIGFFLFFVLFKLEHISFKDFLSKTWSLFDWYYAVLEGGKSQLHLAFILVASFKRYINYSML